MAPARKTPNSSATSTAPAAARSGSTARRSISATCVFPMARPSSTSPIPPTRRPSPRSRSPKAGIPTRCGSPTGSWWSTTSGSARTAATEFGGGLGIYDVENPAKPKLITKWTTHGKGVHRYDVRRPLRLYLADRRGLCRQHRHDPRPQGPGAAGGGRPLVDPRPVDRRAARTIPGTTGCRRAAITRCRVDDRLYVSYWHHGFFILDIGDMSRSRNADLRTSTPARPTRIRPIPA